MKHLGVARLLYLRWSITSRIPSNLILDFIFDIGSMVIVVTECFVDRQGVNHMCPAHKCYNISDLSI